MDERAPSAVFFSCSSPSGLQSSPLNLIRPSSANIDRNRYITELFAERQKLEPFAQVLPICSKLLNQEILRASGLAPTQRFLDPKRVDHGSPLRLSGHHLSGGMMDLEGCSAMQTEDNAFQGSGNFQASSMGWQGAPVVSNNPVVKKVIRLDVPVNKFPSYNFVGRLLGPRGNSLKRVEASTHCRVYIRGRGSVKDSIKEDKLRDKPGYEHLNEQLHVLVEAELPADLVDEQLNAAVTILEDLLKPVDESLDYYKKQQLRELAIINGTLREESPQMSPSASPFSSTAMKRAKTVR